MSDSKKAASSSDADNATAQDPERLTAIQALAQLADPSLIERIVGQKRTLVAEEPHLPLRFRMLPTHVDPDAWGAGFLAIREYERPAQLAEDLRENAPQALLRDVYRPIYESHWVEREPFESSIDPGGRQGYEQVKVALEKVPLPIIEPLTHLVAEEQERRRRLLAETWQPILGDDEPRRQIEVLVEPFLDR